MCARSLLSENNKIAASALRDEFEKSTDDASRRHREEMKLVEERLQVEKQAWQENYMKKQVTLKSLNGIDLLCSV